MPEKSPTCDCPYATRIANLEHHMYGNQSTNTHGVHPIMFGDGADRCGIVQDIRDIKWYGKLALWAITIIGGAILVTLGNLLATKISGGATSTQSVTVGKEAAALVDTAFYSTPQLATILGYSDREIQDRASKGEIPGAWKDGKAWRFDRPSVDAWVAANAATAVTAANAASANQN